MKSFSFVLTAFLSASALAQSMGGGVLPECASIQASNCQSADPSCVCKSPNFASDFIKCVSSNCSPAESAAAISTGLQLCAAAGVSIPPMSGMSGMASTTARGSMPMPSAPASAPSAPPAPSAPSAPSAPVSAPVVPPPVRTKIPSGPVMPSAPVATPTAAGPLPVPATPVPATPVATAGAGTPVSQNASLASVGFAWISTVFVFFFM
ncbi:hypothetical protein ACHAQD_005308 [Fusarium lateritium]